MVVAGLCADALLLEVESTPPPVPYLASPTARAWEAPAVWELRVSKNTAQRSEKLRVEAAFQAQILGSGSKTS